MLELPELIIGHRCRSPSELEGRHLEYEESIHWVIPRESALGYPFLREKIISTSRRKGVAKKHHDNGSLGPLVAYAELKDDAPSWTRGRFHKRAWYGDCYYDLYDCAGEGIWPSTISAGMPTRAALDYLRAYQTADLPPCEGDPHPWWAFYCCQHCGALRDEHLDGKCLYLSTRYVHRLMYNRDRFCGLCRRPVVWEHDREHRWAVNEDAPLANMSADARMLTKAFRHGINLKEK